MKKLIIPAVLAVFTVVSYAKPAEKPAKKHGVHKIFHKHAKKDKKAK